MLDTWVKLVKMQTVLVEAPDGNLFWGVPSPAQVQTHNRICTSTGTACGTGTGTHTGAGMGPGYPYLCTGDTPVHRYLLLCTGTRYMLRGPVHRQISPQHTPPNKCQAETGTQSLAWAGFLFRHKPSANDGWPTGLCTGTQDPVRLKWHPLESNPLSSRGDLRTHPQGASQWRFLWPSKLVAGGPQGPSAKACSQLWL